MLSFSEDILLKMGRDCSHGIATSYGLDGPVIETRRRKNFLQQPRPTLGPSLGTVEEDRVSFPGVKRPKNRVDHPPTSSAEVKERVELYLYSPSEVLGPLLGRNLLTFHFLRPAGIHL
jgi:hypothetical protein